MIPSMLSLKLEGQAVGFFCSVHQHLHLCHNAIHVVVFQAFILTFLRLVQMLYLRIVYEGTGRP